MSHKSIEITQDTQVKLPVKTIAILIGYALWYAVGYLTNPAKSVIDKEEFEQMKKDMSGFQSDLKTVPEEFRQVRDELRELRVEFREQNKETTRILLDISRRQK